MAGEIITMQELADAKVDAKDLGEAVNEDTVVTPRYGKPYKSAPMAMRELTGAIEVAAAAGAGANGWTDLLVLTSDGRTQRQFNENVLANEVELKKSFTLRAVGTYDAFDYVNSDALRLTQAQQYAIFLRKLHTSQPTNITCLGTSITEGFDVLSPAGDRVPAPNNPNNTVSSITYPQALETLLSAIYQSTVAVQNLGYSGDTAQESYQRWLAPRSTDLVIMELGANDATRNIPVEEFLFYLEQSIIRELIQENPVILLQPTKIASSSDLHRDAYSNGMYALGQKYGINVVDTELFLKNAGISFYSDDRHLNTVGYQYFASKVAALLCGNALQNPVFVSDSTKLLSRPTIDGIMYGANAVKEFRTDEIGQTPNENSASGRSTVAMLYGSAGTAVVYYSFYATTDDLIIIPTMLVNAGATVKFTVDAGIRGVQDSMDASLEEPPFVEYTDNTYSYTNTSGATTFTRIKKREMPDIKLRTSGWHLLKVEVTGADVKLFGLEFISYRLLMTTDRLRKTVSTLYMTTVGNYTTSISQTRIPYDELVKALNWDGDFLTSEFVDDNWGVNPPLRIAFAHHVTALTVGYFTLGTRNNAVTTALFGTPVLHKKIAGIPDSDCRQISSVTYDAATAEVVINWAGNLVNTGRLSISVV